jgi:hypothetical protein
LRFTDLESPMALKILKNRLSPVLRSTLPIALLIGIGAICYMAFAHLFGFYNDDWYLIYAGVSQGAEKFHDVFAIDRPFRGYFVGWMYEFIGLHSWLYSLGAFLMRSISSLGLLWILRTLWPEERQAAFVAALLFFVYPGFLDQPNAIDYQSHLWGFALAIVSIGCTIQAVSISKMRAKVFWMVASLVTQLLSLMLMEYYIGLEGLRFLLVGYLSWKQRDVQPIQRAWRAFLRYLPSLVVALGFTYWLTQIFQIQRSNMNVDTIFGNIIEAPALRLIWMVIYLFKDLLNVIVFAWAEPIYHYAFAERLKLLLVEISLAIVAGGMTWLALNIIRDTSDDKPSNPSRPQVARDMAVIGLLAAALALVPIHFTNRQVIFDEFSRFSLPSSAGVALIFAGGWLAMRESRLKYWFVVSLVTLAALAHTGNALNYVDQWKVVRNFWWQVSWRVPQIEPDTVIMADYAGRGIAEDYFVWGPASLIYYPTLPYQEHTMLVLDAATLAESNLNAVIMQARLVSERRGLVSEVDFSNLLVLSMPGELSCVHVIDGKRLELSDQTRSEIMVVAPYSRVDRIMIHEPMIQPPLSIFGEEPPRKWCYYFEKASLARQRGDWEEIIQLGEAATRLDLRPYDWIEWMPFIEANAYTGQSDAMHSLAAIIKENPYYHHQACQEVLADSYHMAELFPEGHTLLFNEFCQSGAAQD